MEAIGKSWAGTLSFRWGSPAALVPTFCLHFLLSHTQPASFTYLLCPPRHLISPFFNIKIQYLPPAKRIKPTHLGLVSLPNSSPKLMSHCSPTCVFLPVVASKWILFMFLCIQLIALSESISLFSVFPYAFDGYSASGISDFSGSFSFPLTHIP